MSSGSIQVERVNNDIKIDFDAPPSGIHFMYVNSTATGTKPTGIGSQSFPMISFAGYTNGVLTNAVQVAVGHASKKIAIRNAPNNNSGATWQDWKYVDADFIPTVGSVALASGSQTQTIVQRGLISQAGMYFINLSTQTNQLNACSLYHVRYYNNAFYVTPIFEGTHDQAPRINSSGVLSYKANQTATVNCKYCVQPVFFQ